MSTDEMIGLSLGRFISDRRFLAAKSKSHNPAQSLHTMRSTCATRVLSVLLVTVGLDIVGPRSSATNRRNIRPGVFLAHRIRSPAACCVEVAGITTEIVVMDLPRPATTRPYFFLSAMVFSLRFNAQPIRESYCNDWKGRVLRGPPKQMPCHMLSRDSSTHPDPLGPLLPQHTGCRLVE